MNPHVLFVDDDHMLIRYYIKALTESGLIVDHYRTAEQALEVAKASSPSLVILDMMMAPGIYKGMNTVQGLYTGVFLYEDLRRIHPEVPFIILTGIDIERLEGRIISDQRMRVVNKAAFPPRELAELAVDMINRCSYA